MAIDSPTVLTQLILDNQLLEPAQIREFTRTLQGRFTETKALARDLVRRGWLTVYQMNRLFQGRVGDLVLGSYVIEERLGEGGMGQVFRARHRLLNRRVALKVIRKEKLASADVVQRFYREIQAAAQLTHPNIVLAYDADNVGDTYFFAMEYVDGVDLARLVKDTGPLPVAIACDFARQAALGLQHAFEHGLVHRDIKPSNLLVTRPGEKRKKGALSASYLENGAGPRPVVKILDMGLVRVEKSLSGQEEQAALTQVQTVLGTPDFIAPEQARDARTADMRSDLYSLGCTLYFLLTGRVPFPGDVAMEKLLKHLLEEPRSLTELRPEVPAAVERIVRKLMAKRPEDRYPTPAAAAVELAEVGNWGEAATVAESPLEEHITLDQKGPGGEAETTVAHMAQMDTVTGAAGVRRQDEEKRRWRIITMGAGTLLLLLVVVLAAVGIYELWPASHRAAPQPPLPEKAEAALQPLRALVDDPQADAETTRRQLLAFRAAYAGTPQGLEAVGLLGKLPAPWDRLSNKNIPAPERAPWQPKELVAVLGEQRLRQVGPVYGVGLADGGTLVLSGGDNRVLYGRDVGTGQTKYALSVSSAPITALAVNKKGTVAATGGADGTVILWDTVHGRRRDEIKAAHAGAVWCLAFSHDGEMVASGGEDKTAKVWTTSEGKGMAEFPGHAGPVKTVAFSNDDQKLATGCPADVVRLWDVKNKAPLPSLPEAAGKATALAFAPDTGYLAIGFVPGTVPAGVRLWDMTAGKEVAPLAVPVPGQLAYAADGKTLATTQGDGTVVLWDTATNQARATLPASPRGRVLTLAFSGDGRTLATGDDQGDVRVYDPATGREQAGPTEPWTTGEYLAFSPVGKPLIASSVNLLGKAWEAGGAQPLLPMPMGLIHAAAFAPEGQTLLLGGDNGTVQLWDWPGGKELVLLGWHDSTVANGGSVLSMAVSPDGTTAASGSRDGMVYLWDLEKKHVRTKLRAHMDPAPSPVTSVIFSPDGQTLATASRDKVVKLWSAATGGKPKLLEGSPVGLSSLAWSPDGKTLAAGADDGAIRRWDVATLRPLSPLRAHVSPVTALTCFADRDSLVSAGRDGRLLFWESSAAKPAREWTFPGPVQAVSLSLEGRYLAASCNGNVYIFRLALAAK